MTIQAFTFYHYITSNRSENIDIFKALFKDDISSLPDKVTSSSALRKHLNLDTKAKEKSFQSVFMEYFKEKVYNSL
jgi:hypothetical protein